jgi:hypothetical protein
MRASLDARKRRCSTDAILGWTTGEAKPQASCEGTGVRRAKLSQDGVHILRHTFCSHLAMRGAPPWACRVFHLQKVLREMPKCRQVWATLQPIPTHCKTFERQVISRRCSACVIASPL